MTGSSRWPTSSSSESEIDLVADTYRSGWLSMGPRTEQLETALREYTGSPHALATSSCTAALHLMCVASGLGEGDEVIVPSLSFVATANAVRYTGATPGLRRHRRARPPVALGRRGRGRHQRPHQGDHGR